VLHTPFSDLTLIGDRKDSWPFHKFPDVSSGTGGVGGPEVHLAKQLLNGSSIVVGESSPIRPGLTHAHWCVQMEYVHVFPQMPSAGIGRLSLSVGRATHPSFFALFPFQFHHFYLCLAFHFLTMLVDSVVTVTETAAET